MTTRLLLAAVAARFADYASVGALEPYAQTMGAAFLPALNQSFTDDGKLYCAPKDVSTLALEINTDMWKKAGLTEATTRPAGTS